MTGAKKTVKPAGSRSQKIVGDEENPTATIPGENIPDAPATRASALIPGAELDTASGPQEVGATRGARRPNTGTLRGIRRPGRAGVADVPFRAARTKEEQEAIDAQVERSEAWAEAQRDPKLKPTMVVATRRGYYGGKRRPAGSMFPMKLPKGDDFLPSWVELAPAKTRAEVEIDDVIEANQDRDDDVLG
jgi:hypothetical protein